MGGQNVIIRGSQDGEVADVAARSLSVLDTQTARIDQGLFYTSAFRADAVADAASIEMLLAVPAAVEPHVTWALSAGGDAAVFVFEGATVSANGTLLGSLNLNRRSSNVAALPIYSGPTVTGDGLQLMASLIPGGDAKDTPGGAGNTKLKIILQESTLYLARLTNLAGSAQPLGIETYWYEEPQI